MPTTSNGSRERNSSSAFLLKIIPFRIADCARVWSARRNKFRSGSRNSKPLALTWSCFNSALNSKKWSASRKPSFAEALPWLRRLRPTPSCESVVLRRILRLLWDVRAAFEIDPVAVGVSERHNPHPISDKWVSADFNSLSCRVTIDRQRVFAHEIDGCAFSHFAAWVPGIVPFFPKLLQHQGRLADLQPAPAEFAVEAALMLQEFRKEGHDSWNPSCKVGEGASIYFVCEDALAIYRDAATQGIKVSRNPFVGNRMWVVPFADPDGYRIYFESRTDVPEETEDSPQHH